jgi:exopolysaccharide biosynthesis protein
VIFLALVICGCSSLSPVREGKREPPAVNITAIHPEWQPVAAGISYYGGRIARPRLVFHALKIKLDYPQLRIVIGAGGESPNPGSVLSVHVSSFVKNNGLLAGINTVPFEPSSAREGEERRVAGIAIADGRLIAPPDSRFAALVFYRDGRVAMASQGEAEAVFADPEIAHAIGGFHRILQNGELTERSIQKRDKPRYPRSAAGLSSDGQILYLIAIDGNRLGSRGATEAETALLLKQLGAYDVLNLDGGGSTALALRFPNGEVHTLNTPIHNGVPGRERAVAFCLGIGVE